MSKTTSDQAFDVVFNVLALPLYYGPRRRLPRMRLSIWFSILFLHCFFTLDPIEDYLRTGFRCGLRYCSCTASLLATLLKTTSDDAFDVVFSVLALPLYCGPRRRLPRMRRSMWSSILLLHDVFAMDPIENFLHRTSLSMLSSILFLHCFFTLDPIEDYLG